MAHPEVMLVICAIDQTPTQRTDMARRSRTSGRARLAVRRSIAASLDIFGELLALRLLAGVVVISGRRRAGADDVAWRNKGRERGRPAARAPVRPCTVPRGESTMNTDAFVPIGGGRASASRTAGRTLWEVRAALDAGRCVQMPL